MNGSSLGSRSGTYCHRRKIYRSEGILQKSERGPGSRRNCITTAGSCWTSWTPKNWRKRSWRNYCGPSDGILVPGGFGARGVEGKIRAIGYAREHGVPFFGICLGMQLAVVEFARRQVGYDRPTARNFFRKRPIPVIYLMREWFDLRTAISGGGTSSPIREAPCVWGRIPAGSEPRQPGL